MSEIVLGLATAHTPLLALSSEAWEHRAAADRNNQRLTLSDGRVLAYQDLLQEVGSRYEREVTPQELARKSARCHAALERLADALAAARPDVVVIIGDDQRELFGPANQPAIAIYHGSEIPMMSRASDPLRPSWMRPVYEAYLMDGAHKVPGSADFARSLVEGLVDRGVDISSADRVPDPLTAGFGHAVGFVVKRLFRGRMIPVVPVLLNTYFPPNVPTAARCYDVGVALRAVIEGHDAGLRVAVVASGGLSHFVVDEELDRGVIAAIEEGRPEVLRKLTRHAMTSGSSEILNWVMAAGVLNGLPVRHAEYYPLRRTEAGTGVGAGFVTWGAISPT
jgi:hypothetical protein